MRDIVIGLFGLVLLAGPAFGERPSELRFVSHGPVPMLEEPVPGQVTRTVLLTDDRLSPVRLVLGPGERVVWSSLAREPSRIVFEREVAAAMICHGLVNFQIVNDELRSAPMRTGDVASFCELAPGTYRYRVVRDGLAGRNSTKGHQLSDRLEGFIVVPPETAGR